MPSIATGFFRSARSAYHALSLLSVLANDYVRTARAKGLAPSGG